MLKLSKDVLSTLQAVQYLRLGKAQIEVEKCFQIISILHGLSLMGEQEREIWIQANPDKLSGILPRNPLNLG